MARADVQVRTGARRARKRSLVALALAACVALAACGDDGGSGDGGTSASGGSGEEKLIMFELSFPCGLNQVATQLCRGAEDAGRALPAGFEFELKTGVEYADNVAYNNLIQTSLQLRPAGLILFPAGPAAQTPTINRACDEGVKIIIVDSPATGVKCQESFIGADHRKLGVDSAKWLIEHPPASREIGIVTQQPGQYASTDARVEGFRETIEDAGYRVVATVVTDLALDRTRTLVSNMMTAHPNIGAVFSGNGPMGQGTAQALKGNRRVVQLSVDGFFEDVRLILAGDVSANAATNPYAIGKLAVEYMARAIDGEEVPRETLTSSKVIDRTNAQQYIDEGGLR